MVTMFWVVGRN